MKKVVAISPHQDFSQHEKIFQPEKSSSPIPNSLSIVWHCIYNYTYNYSYTQDIQYDIQNSAIPNSLSTVPHCIYNYDYNYSQCIPNNI